MNIQDKNDVRALILEATEELSYGNYILNAPEAVELLMGTWAQESAGGKYLKQIGGPALSAWQIERATFRDTINRCKLVHRSVLAETAGVPVISETDFSKIERNHKLACQVARLKYFLCPGSIPVDLEGQADYYKKYYNTVLGRATVEQYIENYRRYVKSNTIQNEEILTNNSFEG